MNRRSYRKTKIRRNKKVRRVKFYGLISLLITLSIFAFKFKDKDINIVTAMENLSKEEIDENAHVLIPGAEHKDKGEIESIIEYGPSGLIGVHYPVFGKEKVDEISKKLANQEISDFKKEIKSEKNKDKDYKYELSIDYETYSGPGDIVSVKFNIIRNSSYLAHPDEAVITKVYDINKDRELELKDIMNNEYLKYISKTSESKFSNDEVYKDSVESSLFKEGISPDSKNYSNFVLESESISFIFPRYQIFSGNYGTTSIDISYSELKDFIKADLVKTFIKEEKLNESNAGVEKPFVEINIPKRKIDPDKPMIALTFDDGPNKKTTIPILDALKEYDSAATFFMLGNRVSSNADILKRILEEGSEIGNHSFNHKELTKLSSDELQNQIKNTQNSVKEVTGIEPKMIRPTYGSYNDKLKLEAGMPLILWSIDTLDWKSRDSRKVTDHVLENIKDGDIVLMHDIYDSTAEAVKILVPKLIDMGYQLVTVSELYESRGEVLKEGQVYNHMYKK